MTLLKVSLLNGLAVIVKMLTLLGLNKILAIYVGPAGYAALGQFQSFVQLINSVAGSTFAAGITKYTAEYHDDAERQRLLWKTAGVLSLILSLIMSAAVIIFRVPLAIFFLKDQAYEVVFLAYGFSLVLFVFNTIFISIFNGKKEFERYVIVSIYGSVITFLVTSGLAFYYGLLGALIALAVNQCLTFLVSLVLICRTRWFQLHYVLGRLQFPMVRRLAGFAAMSLVGAICVPVSHILIRNYIGETLGWMAAGNWEAMWRLSASYLLLVTSTLSVYFLPRFSELHDRTLIKSEVVSGYKLLLPLTLIGSVAIFTVRESLIVILFSDEFGGMSVLFGWQMVGDTLKIVSWLLAYIMISKAMFAIFISSELFFSFLFYILTMYFVPRFGLEGVAIAHAVNYGCYTIFVFLVVGSWLNGVEEKVL